MKIEKSNNPTAVGALVLILFLIVGRILWMVFGHGGSVAAASTVSTRPPVPVSKPVPTTAATPILETDRVSSLVTPVTTRNPFSVAARPAVAVTRRDDSPHHDASQRATTGADAAPLMPLPPLPLRVSELGLGAGAKQPPAPHGLDPLPQQQIAANRQAEPQPTLRLTATVGGTKPLAVVQTTDPQPVVLRVGDLLDGMRVAAIHEQEVVFARGNGFWTLRLQSADSITAGSFSVTSVPAPSEPVTSVVTPEEQTDELQK